MFEYRTIKDFQNAIDKSHRELKSWVPKLSAEILFKETFLMNNGRIKYLTVSKADLNNYGVYLIFNKQRVLLYIGTTKREDRRLRGRLHSLFHGNHTFSSKLLSQDEFHGSKKEVNDWIYQNCLFRVIINKNQKDANLLERQLIASLNPIYNDQSSMGYMET